MHAAFSFIIHHNVFLQQPMHNIDSNIDNEETSNLNHQQW